MWETNWTDLAPTSVGQINESGQWNGISTWKLTKTLLCRKKGWILWEDILLWVFWSPTCFTDKNAGPWQPFTWAISQGVCAVSSLEGWGNVSLQDKEQACLVPAIKWWFSQAPCFSPRTQPTTMCRCPPELSTSTPWDLGDKGNRHRNTSAYAVMLGEIKCLVSDGILCFLPVSKKYW